MKKIKETLFNTFLPFFQNFYAILKENDIKEKKLVFFQNGKTNATL
ncbi:MAG: hypothetical protein ACI4I2_03910 [Oscillospiraceae bacterium]